jgi:beta-xylosidase
MKKILCLTAVLVSIAGYAQIEQGKVYTISNAKSETAFMQDNFNDDNIVETYGENEYSYWTFIPTGADNCYYIKNYTTGRYIQSHGTTTEVAVTMGAEPAEYCVMAFDSEGGAYGFSSTNNANHNFTNGCVGLNLRAEPWENNCCAQTYAAVAGTNHRSFWKINEVDASTITVPEIVTAEDLSGVDEDLLYFNPVVAESLPDPTIIKADDGYFYLYATENIRNMPIYRSNNLVDWDFVGTCFTEETRPTFVQTTRQSCLWAPDINYFDGRYVMYYSMSDWGGEWTCGIGVATADKPEGPFTDHGPLFISSEMGTQNSIDPFFIEDDGHKYLFWGSFSGIWYTELSDDGLSLKNGLTYTQIAGTLTEGTYIVKHDGYYYMIGSAGSCCSGLSSTYRLLVARSESLFGPYVNKAGRSVMDNCWSKLLGKSAEVVGPGHCSEIVEDEAGQSWIFYHGFDAETGNGRYLYMDQIHWGSDGWPQIADSQPSTAARRPVFTTDAGVQNVADNSAKPMLSSTRVENSFNINVADNGSFTWQLTNTHGQVVAKGKAKGETTVNTQAIPWGLYIVTINHNGTGYSEKIIRL